MAKRKNAPAPCGCASYDEPPPPPLKKQSRWSGDPWQPGEIPAGSFMPVSKPHGIGVTPYGHGSMAVERPVNRGKRKPEGL